MAARSRCRWHRILCCVALLWLAAPEILAAEPFRDCEDCPEMVVVPAGEFDMGLSDEQARALGVAPTSRTLPWQQPRHRVVIGRPFALAAAPVTREEYARFARERGEGEAGIGWESPGIRQGGRDPVVRVSWRQAQAYLRWLSGRAGHAYRLPTEAEWEYAARAGTTTARWWGDDIGTNRTVCDDCGSPWDGKGTAPVRSFDPSPFGLYDMIGQVFEWTADCWNPHYRGAPANGAAWLDGDCGMHPARGGSWNLDSRLSSASQRSRDATDYEGNMVGFRVARDLH